MRPGPLPRKQKAGHRVATVLTTVLTIALVLFGAWRFGSRWYKRIKLVADVAWAAGDASVDRDESSGGPKNLWYEKCAMLFVKQTNHLEVAKACQDYWKTQLHKNLLLLNSQAEYMHPGEYELVPAHNGYVRIIGAFQWPVTQHEGLAQYLSQTFGTLVFEWRSESFADTYHFGIYDQGARKFHAQMDVNITQSDAKETVTTEGNDFAIANGFKPGSEGFKNFHVLEADQLTQRLGMKLWDEKDGAEIKGVLLKENPPPPANQ